MSLAGKSTIPTQIPGETRKSNRFRLVIRILIWLLIPLLAWLSIKDINLAQVKESFHLVGLQAISILLAINVFIFILFSLRWWLILRAQGIRIALISVIGYRLAGFGVTYFTPGPQFGGEPLQVYLLKEREGISVSPAATSVAVDKLLELLANFSFLLVGVTVLVFSGILNMGNDRLLILFPAFLVAVPGFYTLALYLGYLPVTAISTKLGLLLSRYPKYQKLTKTFGDTETMVSKFCHQNVLALFLGAVLSILIWVLMVFEFGLMLQFLGVQLNLAQVLIALTAARIAFLLPFPAGLGTLEAGQVMAMGLIGVNPAVGISLSLLIRARDVLFGGAGLGLSGFYNR